MGKFDYQKAQQTALRLIGQFGQSISIVRIFGEYDPVSGSNSNQTFIGSPATVVTLPMVNGLGLTGDDKFKEDLKKGKIRGFYIAAKGLLFEPQPGDLLVFENEIWDIGGGTPLNPAGTPVLYTVGCRSSGLDFEKLSTELYVYLSNNGEQGSQNWVNNIERLYDITESRNITLV